ncbi:hypothetical protein EDC23_2539 [Thiohalophilus thiocyanatoxydans]|uniref:Transposase n=1 Tax=Thiohalophilus thiocyanatoxydans TaxID=381308 RepID=A0A4R8IP94_9GAMM|nr:hypothetical protein EDC23_2539 [Thiohalophilus thiocyanatoxydans]
MPRKPRFFLPDVPVHVVQRGHSREPVFFEDGDYLAYRHWLLEAVRRYSCEIKGVKALYKSKGSKPFTERPGLANFYL